MLRLLFMIVTKRMAQEAYNEMISVDVMLDEQYKGFKVGSHKAALAFVFDRFDLSNPLHKKQVQLIFKAFKEILEIRFSEKQMTHKEVRKITEKVKVGELDRFFSCFPWGVA